jgi:hypothetical protein
LKGYGFQADIKGEAVDVKGYEYYKGGLFRSNKTVTKDVNQQDADELRNGIENVRESAKALARVMGYGTEAIDNYTGSLRVNLKGVKNGQEAAERYNEALDKLHLQMLNTVPGLKMNEQQFKEFIENITKDMEAVGITASSIAEVIMNGMLGRISQEQVGEQLSDIVIGGIYNALASQPAGQIADVFTGQIIQPIFTAIAAGVPISQAISQQAIANVVATAQQAAAALNAIFADPGFRAAIAGVQQAIGGISVAAKSVKVPQYKVAVKSYNDTANAAARAAQAVKDAWASIADDILDEMKRIRSEILGETDVGMAYAMSQFMIATARARAGDKDAAGELTALSAAIIELAKATANSEAELRLTQGQVLQSLTDTRAIIGAKYGISLPAFAVGTNYIPQDMIALLHKGEAVVPEAYNPAANGETGQEQSASANSAMVAELRLLRIEVEGLRASGRQTADNTRRATKVLEEAQNGIPLATEAA